MAKVKTAAPVVAAPAPVKAVVPAFGAPRLKGGRGTRTFVSIHPRVKLIHAALVAIRMGCSTVGEMLAYMEEPRRLGADGSKTGPLYKAGGTDPEQPSASLNSRLGVDAAKPDAYVRVGAGGWELTDVGLGIADSNVAAIRQTHPQFFAAPAKAAKNK